MGRFLSFWARLIITFTASSAMANGENARNLWQSLIERAAQETATEFVGINGEYYRVLEIASSENRQANHTADYFSVIGRKQVNAFLSNHVEIVTENWVLEEDEIWRIEQWVFVLALNGLPIRINHNIHKRTKPGQILLSTELPASPEERVEALRRTLHNWFERWPQLKPLQSVPFDQENSV